MESAELSTRFFVLAISLANEEYMEVSASAALPLLTAQMLTDFLTLSQQQDQDETLLAFEEWLRVQ